MCRLFGLTAGRARVDATFWLLDAPDSLQLQSRENPDGTGLGWFDESGTPVVEKEALPAYRDIAFAGHAQQRRSTTFVAHVRKSTGAPPEDVNTHPFVMDGRIFAHNGSLGDLPRLEAHLGADLHRVRGATDSERYFALVTREIARADGDVQAGLAAAVAWIHENLPVVSANLVLAEPGRLWALRLPDARELWFLDRHPTGDDLDHRSSLGTRVHSPHLSEQRAVVVASEPLDEEGWQLLDPGELLVVDPDLRLERSRILSPTKESAS